MPIERDELIELIPHDGCMCLIDRVETWDDSSLRASTGSHRAGDHPLARHGGLSIVHALEYGAQAMAIHGGLLARCAQQRVERGYLASARGLRLHRARLDDVEADLQIDVTREFVQAGNLVYRFCIAAEGELVAEGMATVVSF